MDLDDLLNSPLNGNPESDYEVGLVAAAGVSKGNYSALHSFRNVQSHSMDELFHACPREWQIKKLRAAIGERHYSSNPTFAFGHAVGAGVAVFDKTHSLDQAIFAAFLAWNIDLFAEQPLDRRGHDPKKSFAWVVWALEKYEVFYHDELMLHDWEVVDMEATLLVDLQDGDEDSSRPSHLHTGHCDELLQNRETGQFKVKENKTTAYSSIHPAMYSNSSQTLGYAVIVSLFGGTDYDVLYTVYSSSEERWVQLECPKSQLHKVEWVKDTLLTAEQMNVYSDEDYFPKRGSNCFRYNRECPEYGTCDLNLDRQFGMKFAELPVATIADLNEIEPFKYVVTRDQLVASLRAKLESFTDDTEELD